jgi:hypothetical protein
VRDKEAEFREFVSARMQPLRRPAFRTCGGRQAVRRLPARHRAVLVLRFLIEYMPAGGHRRRRNRTAG